MATTTELNLLPSTFSEPSTAFVCPLTLQLFRDPVIAEDGYTYEREAIIKYINEKHKSPIKPLQNLSIDGLRLNLQVKKMVEEFERTIQQKHYRFKLNVDIKKGRKTLFQAGCKVLFEAEWLRKLEGPKIVLLKIFDTRPDREASFYVELSRHQHILRTYGLVEQDPPDLDSVMLLQEYAPEGSLFELLEDQKSVPHESILFEMFIQIADAMSFLAYNRIIHGDLACRNILVFRFDEMNPKNNLVKVTDFGLSRATSIYSPISANSRSTINIIPIRYAAPEVLRHDNLSKDVYSEKSDMFSMGVLMWEAYSK
ncbi:unnamed protein product, partial [Didymodactylos carnosus]